MARTKHRKKPNTTHASQRIEVDPRELQSILDETKATLSEERFRVLQAAMETLAFITEELRRKGTSIRRLQKLIFGPTSEKTAKVCPEACDQNDGGEGRATTEAGEGPKGTGGPGEGTRPEGAAEPPKKRRKGESHGRHPASAYTGAEKVVITLEGVHSGDPCPECPNGKLYPLPKPKVIVQVKAMAPLNATVYELARWRCNLCGEIFTADAPEGVGPEKYDETAAAMIVLFRYSVGLPFNRIEKLEKGFGIPLASSTQWEIAYYAADEVEPAHEELIRQAAQAERLHNDDTKMKILDLPPFQPVDEDGKPDGDERTGIYTTGIVAETSGHTIALYFSGHQHAGENLADVLSRRAKDLPPPIHMCDGLSHNTKGIKGTLLASCLVHARRQFVDVEPDFPDEVKHLLESLRVVFHNNALAAQQGLSPLQRLAFHQEHSEPVMKDLKVWMEGLLAEKLVEPNSGLGKAIKYTTKRWEQLTLFLRVPGAPIDNNCAERILKKAIVHRNNSLFYKTITGGEVGDTFMSLIQTAELNGADPFDYLVALQRHSEELARSPGEWMPWNYKETLARMTSEPTASR